MPLALFVSPHLDDVAFSCSGLLARLAQSGWQCVLATVFTASVPSPQGFALACQTEKGLPPEADYMSLRRSEDAAYVAALNRALSPSIKIVPLWLPLREAPHRGYGSAAELFGARREDDHATTEVAGALQLIVECLSPDLIAGPAGYGNHVDHRVVIDAVDSLAIGKTARVFYRDTPYVLKNPTASAAIDLTSLQCVTIDTAEVEGACLDAIACYRTQLPFQFGGDAAMRRQMAQAYRGITPGRVAESVYADARAASLLTDFGVAFDL